MSDLNTATPILVHTPHTVISGPYHRNGEAILAVLDFFETDEKTARTIAERYAIDYVVFCNEQASELPQEDRAELRYRLIHNELPEWLQWVSQPDADLLIARMVR